MIQELLGSGGAGLFGGERKISINGGVLEGTPSHSPSPSPSPSSSTVTTTTNTVPNSENQNLRCPRCDSANTKFCYYNNYNLTQPRHFCKTCRRYWTKGGALRNVPIGGGCRKNKNTCISTPVGKSSAGKVMKTTTLSTSEIGKSGLGMYGFDHELASNNNPIVWASPQNSHILALLRATQNPNPNQISSSGSITVKDEGFNIGSNMLNESSSVATGAFNALTLGLDPFSQVPSFWRNNQHQQPQQQQQQQQNGFNLVGEVQNSGIQELYQRMRTSSNYYSTTDHHVPVGMGNLASTLSSSTSSILESAPVGGGNELGGYWNSANSTTWSDLPTANGAYP